MELIVKGSFYRDIHSFTDKNLLRDVFEVIIEIEQAQSIAEIHNLKKLKLYKTHYRIKVAEVYRIGIVIRTNKVWLVCFGHRSKFYQRFP